MACRRDSAEGGSHMQVRSPSMRAIMMCPLTAATLASLLLIPQRNIVSPSRHKEGHVRIAGERVHVLEGIRSMMLRV